jgi:hypothetical protein
MFLLNPLLKKLHIESAAVPNLMVFLKTRLFVKWNSAEFTNVSGFTLLLKCSTYFTLSCRILLAFSTCNSFVQFVFAEIPVQSAWGAPVDAPLVLVASLSIAIHQNWAHSDSGFLISETLLLHAGSFYI